MELLNTQENFEAAEAQAINAVLHYATKGLAEMEITAPSTERYEKFIQTQMMLEQAFLDPKLTVEEMFSRLEHAKSYCRQKYWAQMLDEQRATQFLKQAPLQVNLYADILYLWSLAYYEVKHEKPSRKIHFISPEIFLTKLEASRSPAIRAPVDKTPIAYAIIPT